MVKDYVKKEFELSDDFFKSRKFPDAEGRTLVALILSVWCKMTYSEIAQNGYTSSQLAYHRVKQGYTYLDSDKRFTRAFWKFQKQHRKLVREVFNIKVEEDWEEEEVKLMRISNVYFYLSINGKSVRIDIDVIKALGYIGEFVDRERGLRLLDKNRLMYTLMEKDTK